MRKWLNSCIRQRLALSRSTIGYNQITINRILNNPKTPKCNREAAIKFVKDYPRYFTPRPTNTDDPELNRYNGMINGDNPDHKFMSKFICCDRSRHIITIKGV